MGVLIGYIDGRKVPSSIHCHGDLDVCEDNPVPGGWYFWDEIGGCNGPFDSSRAAIKAFDDFLEWLGK